MHRHLLRSLFAALLLFCVTSAWSAPAELLSLLVRAQGATKTALLVERAQLLIKADKINDALPILDELVLAKRGEGTIDAIAFASELERKVNQLRLENLRERLEAIRDPNLELLKNVDPTISGLQVVSGSVKRFSKDFQAGASNPQRYLSELKKSQPALLKKWLETPVERRIFLIGAGKDGKGIGKTVELLKSKGFQVFFYDFCRQSKGALCSSKEVGAMFATSGNTILYKSSLTFLSEYVKVEAATARFLVGADKKVILLSSSELLLSVQGPTKFTMFVANHEN